jgi:hypothetical protein
MGNWNRGWFNTAQFLGYTWNQKNLKQPREHLKQNWVFYLKCFVKIKTGVLLLTFINKNLEILAQTRSYFSIIIFCPPIVALHFFDWTKITMPPLVLFIISMHDWSSHWFKKYGVFQEWFRKHVKKLGKLFHTINNCKTFFQFLKTQNRNWLIWEIPKCRVNLFWLFVYDFVVQILPKTYTAFLSFIISESFLLLK